MLAYPLCCALFGRQRPRCCLGDNGPGCCLGDNGPVAVWAVTAPFGLRPRWATAPLGSGPVSGGWRSALPAALSTMATCGCPYSTPLYHGHARLPLAMPPFSLYLSPPSPIPTGLAVLPCFSSSTGFVSPSNVRWSSLVPYIIVVTLVVVRAVTCRYMGRLV
jgi:hypothetical protein